MSTRVFNAKFWLNKEVSKIERLLLDCLAAAGDDDGDIIKNIYLSNQSIAEATNMACRSVIRTCFSLEEKGILKLITDKVNTNERFVISMNDLATYLRPGYVYDWQYKNGKREKVIHRQVTDCHHSKKNEVTLCPPEVTLCPPEVTLCPPEVTECHTTLSLPLPYPFNNPLGKSYFVSKEFKIQNLDHAKNLIAETIKMLANTGDVDRYYPIPHFVEEMSFHIQQYPEDQWAHEFNRCIDLAIKRSWSVPFKLRAQREAEAIAREKADKAELEQERKDLNSNNSVVHAVFGKGNILKKG